ncbi:nucleotide exchange factor GrpE [Candidatus Falkowbacteria bacterium HGW-Falkowbacteria-2]|uniref:Protein GrpE n=1 Tax=Candidatus Falkowbacteria bacterium HGW-Falkowbacteria-2 TaxID=2013769 RepID=A0A2N2E3F9_9BACT|nr:MAG: nucleotide exchange factor GrpE [Candidatus Falkowbacteria bacterium HGW-Falkowbacteria-2]
MSKIKLGIYRHYKGDEYELFEIAKSSESKEEIAIYRSVKDGQVWARPISMWKEEVEVDDAKKPRFEYLREAENDSFEHKYLRALADYQNQIKQASKDKEEFVKFVLGDFLQEILPVYDHLKLSLAGLSEQDKESAWVKGVEYVLKQFKDVLNGRGVEEIKTVGEKYDYHRMEALEGTGEKVIREVSPGYVLNGRVIRPAKVIVGEE